MVDPNAKVAGNGHSALEAAGISVRTGLLQDEAASLNAGFLSRMQRGRPLVRLKIAASLDGKTAMANGESQWITGTAARDDVQRLRAASGAVMVGTRRARQQFENAGVSPNAELAGRDDSILCV